MRYLFVSLFISIVASAFPNSINHILLNLKQNPLNVSKAQEKWIEQELDHFDPREKGTYKMRYFENLELWQPNAPIYIFIGGESEQSPLLIENYDMLLLIQIARETKGALFATEHRYYGKSIPVIAHDDEIQYYRFLNSRQALADIAFLIQVLKSDPKYAFSKVVVIGGSYPGNLATWMRLVYPELVTAAIAISAPVLAKTDFHEFLDVVRYTYGTYGTQNCLFHIQNTFTTYEELLKSERGTNILKKRFNICPISDMTVLENRQTFFRYLYSPLTKIAQSGSTLAVKNKCITFESGIKTTQDFPHLHKIDSSCTSRCTHFDFKAVNWTARPWIHQMCTEFGYFTTTSSEKQPFVHWNPLEYMVKICKDYVKGDIEKGIDDAVAKTNEMYGGLTPNVSKVVFTHGDMDPWRSLGVQTDLAPDVPVIMDYGSSHGGILAYQDGQPEQLKESRKKVKELIKKWISTPESEIVFTEFAAGDVEGFNAPYLRTPSFMNQVVVFLFYLSVYASRLVPFFSKIQLMRSMSN